MSVAISAEHEGCADVQATRAMFSDPRFYELLTELTPGADTVSLQIEADGQRVTWSQQIRLPDSVPASLRSVVGAAMTITETQQWLTVDGRHSATVHLVPAGLPAQLTGTYEIRPAAAEAGSHQMTGLDTKPCMVHVTAQVQVAIPIFGAKVEAIITEHFREAVSVRSQAARLWQS